MAVNFDSLSLDSRKMQMDYKCSLSDIENAWSNIASAKEKLDFVDRRIKSATLYGDNLHGEPRHAQKQGMSKFVRKYSKRNTGNRVKIDPNPKIGFTEANEEINISETKINEGETAQEKFKRHVTVLSRDSSQPKHLPSHGGRNITTASDNIANDFDYDPNDLLPSERPVTPKVPRLDSSIDRKSILSNIKDSGAIERIRKQIKQQKDNLSSPEMQALPSKPKHTESDHVVVNDDKPKGPMKRKVISSTHAPSYKGFNMPEAKENIAHTIKTADNQNRKIVTHKERKERVGSAYLKGKTASRTSTQDNNNIKKESKRSPGKMQRIVAHRRPVPSITARSWRVGQEAVKKVLQSMKESKKQSLIKIEGDDKEAERLHKKDNEHEESDNDHINDGREKSRESETQTTERSDEQKSDSPRSEHIQKESHQSKTNEISEESKENSDRTSELDKISKDLHENEDLPEEAKTMLADLQLDPSDTEEKHLSPTISKAPLRGVMDSSGVKKMVKRKVPQRKPKEEDDKSYRPKIRHYDQEEIQNYMAKQLAERKKKRLQEKRREKLVKLEHEQKLKELYIKQKNSLRSSISSRHPKTLGSTFTKQNQNEESNLFNQDRNRQETAVKRLMEDGDVILLDSITKHQDEEEVALPTSTPAGESSKWEHSVSSKLNESSEYHDIEDQFKDSLEFDKLEDHGIKSITVKKVRNGSPARLKHQETGEVRDIHMLPKSVESEVQELLEKYKASRQFEPKATESRNEIKPTNDLAGHNKLSKAERIAAIAATASTLRERLAAEADRLSYLRMLSNSELPPASSPTPFTSTVQSTEFKGALPGTRDIYEQAKTNEEIAYKEKAATKIQAAFRGHSIRQGLSWKLPSGKTFGASLRDMRQKSAAAVGYKKELEAQDERRDVESYTTSFEPESDIDLFSDRTSTESLIKEAEKPHKSREGAVPKFQGLQYKTSRNKQEYVDPLKEIYGRNHKGDRYSVINVLARRLKEAKEIEGRTAHARMRDIEGTAMERGHMSNEELYEQDFEDGEYDSLSSTIKSDLQVSDEGDGEQWKSILTDKDNLVASKSEKGDPSLGKKLKGLENDVEEDLDKTLVLLPEDLPGDEEPSVKISSYHSDKEDSVKSSVSISPARSRISLTEGSVDYEKEPIMSSTLRTAAMSHEERRHLNEQDTSLTVTNTATEMFSPSTLERKLRAEVNQLETMDDALRQVTDIERVRGVTLAHQETVSLAQVLKARQFGYQQELEKMSKDATERAIRNAKEVEQAKATAVEASENASKRLAEIRAEAAEVVAESAKKLEEVQKEAARRAEEAAGKIEKAHKMASDVAVESANRYSNDMQTMATTAASVAASSAVQAAMQVHREQLEQLRNEALKRVSRSYSHSTDLSASAHSESTETKTLTDSMSDKQKSKTADVSYDDDDDDFEEPTYRKSEEVDKDSGKSLEESIKEDIDESKVDRTINSRSKIVESENGKHSTPLKEGENLKSGFEDFLPQSEIEEQSFKIDDHIMSSLTEDEIDDGFRMVLPVMSHRRKSMERERRSRREKALPDNGTSSDEMKHAPRSASKHGKHSPFAGEDTFGQFTNDLVKQYIQEEEIRSSHQRALLKLREKALLEKAKAEMAWLEMQKSTLRNKGADDLMPPLNKKQRGLWMKLQSEQNEIRRLKQAYRTASHERRFMLYQQEEIVRLKEETQKIWSKLGRDKAAKSHENFPEEKIGHSDKSVSEVSSIASVDQSSAVSLKSNSSDIPSKTPKASSYSPKTKTPSTSMKQDSKSSVPRTEVPEESPSTHQLSPDTKDASFPTYSGGDKTSPDSHLKSSMTQKLDEGESSTEDVSITEHTHSSMIVDLKMLAKKTNEQYLNKRERVLKERRNKFESIMNNQLGMSSKKQKIEMEESRLKSDIKKALNQLKVKSKPLSLDTSSREDASESSESTIKSQKISPASRTSSTKSILSKEKSSESESSVTEDIKTGSIATENTAFQGSMAVGDAQKSSKASIQEDYVDDTFDSSSAAITASKSISYHPDNVLTSSARTLSKKRYTKDSDESKSEDDLSFADATSDASDIEKRIRQLEEELLKRRKDLDRIRRKREKDQLRKQEQRLKQELQAVESLILQENVNHERSISESNSIMKAPVSPKIMSPKVLQPANQHDHLGKKQTRESKPLNEFAKLDQNGLDKSLQNKRDSARARQVTSTATGESKERSEKDGNASPRSLSEEVEALRKIAQNSIDNRIYTKSPEKVAVDIKKKSREEKDETNDLPSSLKDRSTSPSISPDISGKSNRSKYSDFEKSSSRISSSIKSIDKKSQLSETASSSQSIIEELSGTIDSVRSSQKDVSVVVEEYNDDHADSLRSVSENIFSEKSIEEELSHGRSVSSVNDSRKDQKLEDIYSDDFFESSSSARSLQSQKNTVKEKGNHIIAELEKKKSEISSSRDVDEVSYQEDSMKSDSVPSKAGDKSTEEKVSQALSAYESFSVNDRVIVDGLLKGTIRYIGRTSFSPVAVAGIELDERVGNTDGKFRNKRYFTCSLDYGLFIPVANIEHLEGKDDLERKVEELKGKKGNKITDVMSESLESDINADLTVKSDLSQEFKEERESQSSIKEEITGHSQVYETVSAGQKEESSSRGRKEVSYKDDFEDDEKSATGKELSYIDDFENGSAREERSSISIIDYSKNEGHEEASRGSAPDYFSSHTSLEKEDAIDKEVSQPIFDDLQVSLRKDMSAASPSTLSDAGSSDIEVVPHPPRLNLDQLAESLTEGLLKTLMAESVEATMSFVGRKSHEADDSNMSLKSPPSYRSGSSQIEKLKNDEVIESGNEIPEENVGIATEKSGYSKKGTKGSLISDNYFEVSEAFVTPAADEVLLPDENEMLVPGIDEEKDLRKVDNEQNHGLVDDILISDEEQRKASPSTKSVTSSDIENVSRTLMLEAISQMMMIMKEKNAKLLSDENLISIQTSGGKSSEEMQKVEKRAEKEPKELLGDLPKLFTSPPKSPTELDLGKKQSAIDTDLLAAKLSELKRIDKEIDVLLDEDSDDDEKFPPLSKRVLSDDEADIIPPVRIFDFSEPIIHVPNTQKDISDIVTDSAKIVIASVVNGEDYDDVQPDENFLCSDLEETDGELEASSRTLFKRMIFDVTRDLMKEVNEFKHFQTLAKQPWTKPNRRVFAKFIRQIHNLSGEELMESFQDHICICLGLKDGRPSLELLKKRLPLNTSKKDYIDALLVEELREEEPNWINYDEDEIRVKEQLTEGILESLIVETVDILNDINLRCMR